MQVRHFTASGIVLDDGSARPIEHARLGSWTPPGWCGPGREVAVPPRGLQ